MSEADFNLLDPPTFELPSDYHENPSDYELWSLRVPIVFDLSQLNGQMVHIQNLENSTKSKRSGINHSAVGPEAILTSFQIESNIEEDDLPRTYNLSQCQQNETQSFRILRSKKQKGNDDDDDEVSSRSNDGHNKEMTPMPITFTKNLTIVETTHSNVTELDLAPSIYKAPKVDLEKEKMRIPYVSIDQKSGLKKRWNVFGSNASFILQQKSNENVTTAKSSKKRASNTTTTSDENIIPSTPSKYKEFGTKRKVSDDVVEESPKIKSPEKKKKKEKKSKSPKRKKL